MLDAGFWMLDPPTQPMFYSNLIFVLVISSI